jgi:hypothetical protein
MKIKLHVSNGGHAILHVASLVWIKPITYQSYSPLQLAFGQPPNIFHFHIFCCTIYVSIVPPDKCQNIHILALNLYLLIS